MTLTYPIINRARNILWLIAGQGKAEILNRLIQADPGIPSGRVNQSDATVIADTAALSRHLQN
jgi:6-phosphogluconolactonase